MCGTYSTNNHFEYEITILCDTHKFFKRKITANGAEATAGAKMTDRNNKKVIFKNCVQFTDLLTEINGIYKWTKEANAKDHDTIMSIYYFNGSY